jgi:hypothetical protein
MGLENNVVLERSAKENNGTMKHKQAQVVGFHHAWLNCTGGPPPSAAPQPPRAKRHPGLPRVQALNLITQYRATHVEISLSSPAGPKSSGSAGK